MLPTTTGSSVAILDVCVEIDGASLTVSVSEVVQYLLAAVAHADVTSSDRSVTGLFEQQLAKRPPLSRTDDRPSRLGDADGSASDNNHLSAFCLPRILLSALLFCILVKALTW